MTTQRFPIYTNFDHRNPPVGFVECDPAILKDSDFVLTLGCMVREKTESGQILNFEVREFSPIHVMHHSAVSQAIECQEAKDARITELEASLLECATELRHTNQQLLHEGYKEGMTITNALAKAYALLNP